MFSADRILQRYVKQNQRASARHHLHICLIILDLLYDVLYENGKDEQPMY